MNRHYLLNAILLKRHSQKANLKTLNLVRLFPRCSLDHWSADIIPAANWGRTRMRSVYQSQTKREQRIQSQQAGVFRAALSTDHRLSIHRVEHHGDRDGRGAVAPDLRRRPMEEGPAPEVRGEPGRRARVESEQVGPKGDRVPGTQKDLVVGWRVPAAFSKQKKPESSVIQIHIQRNPFLRVLLRSRYSFPNDHRFA